MVDVAPIETLDHEVPWESKVLADLERLLVNILGSEVLSDATVVRVAQLSLVVLVVEQVVDVHVVDVALYAVKINIVCLLLILFFLLCFRLLIILIALMFFIIFFFFVRVRLHLVCLFEPGMG